MIRIFQATITKHEAAKPQAHAVHPLQKLAASSYKSSLPTFKTGFSLRVFRTSCGAVFLHTSHSNFSYKSLVHNPLKLPTYIPRAHAALPLFVERWSYGPLIWVLFPPVLKYRISPCKTNDKSISRTREKCRSHIRGNPEPLNPKAVVRTFEVENRKISDLLGAMILRSVARSMVGNPDPPYMPHTAEVAVFRSQASKW